MKKSILLLVVFFTSFCVSQTKNDIIGIWESVILKPNGTWEYSKDIRGYLEFTEDGYSTWIMNGKKAHGREMKNPNGLKANTIYKVKKSQSEKHLIIDIILEIPSLNEKGLMFVAIAEITKNENEHLLKIKFRSDRLEKSKKSDKYKAFSETEFTFIKYNQ